MIEYNGVKMSAKDAACHLAITRLMHVGDSTDEQEMLLAMTAKQLDVFFREYTANYNKICSRIGADGVDSNTLAHSTIQRILVP